MVPLCGPVSACIRYVLVRTGTTTTHLITLGSTYDGDHDDHHGQSLLHYVLLVVRVLPCSSRLTTSRGTMHMGCKYV